MDPGRSSCRPRRSRGASAAEYLVALILVGIAGITTYHRFGTAIRCKLLYAVGLFSSGVDGSGASAPPECGGPDSSGGSSQPASGNSDNCPNGSCMMPDGCFVAGTPVLTESGWLPIESVVTGMRVLSRDEDGTANEWKPVTRTFVLTARSLVALTLVDARGDDETLLLTPDHRVHVETRGFVAADALAPGADTLVDEAGAPLYLQAAESLPEEVTVFNLEVADDHTYFVGRHAAWVHNGCKKGDHIFNNSYSQQVFKKEGAGLSNSNNCPTKDLGSAFGDIQNNLNQAESDCQVTVSKDGPTTSDGDQNSQQYGAAKKAFTDALAAAVQARITFDTYPSAETRQALRDAVAAAQTAASRMREEAYDPDAANLVSAKDKAKLIRCQEAFDAAQQQLDAALQAYADARRDKLQNCSQ